MISNGEAVVAQQSGWRSLFDGKTLDGWRAYKTQDPPRGWAVVDGTITKQRGAQDLVTKDQFGDFELELEWKIGEAGNSGIFYRGTEEYDHIYWSAPEYQLLDNLKAVRQQDAAHARRRLTTGSIPRPTATIIRPASGTRRGSSSAATTSSTG